MIDYDYLILSPNEFENISRDLLQKVLSVFIESFTSGRDGGIDLRCATDKDSKVIIQAKRYKTYSSLLTNLKKELSKVNNLAPDRYIVTTSVGLTPENKKEIHLLFSPFIQTTKDILGRDDLNNLIGKNPDIERQYYKLWFSSINILEKVLHSKVYNQSAFELEEIKEQIKLYVQNDSFDEALNILNKNRYLIISGIPGIGKTTLARVLVLHLLSNDFEEFIFLNQSIDDGYELFVDEKKQVFFFDDFLGKNFLENRFYLNEDNKIVKFIEKIKKSHNKALIFTTREYILKQAKSSFEAFNIKNIEIAKCVLDLSSYTNIIKAQILYNHLFFANIPLTHITNLIENNSYLKLVKHRNYNPRIIEAIINRKIWNHCLPEQFANVLISFFENPESVWLHAFENTLNKLSQSSLLVLLTMGTPALLDDWEKAVREFFKINNFKYSIDFDSIQFNKAIKELESTFIRTQIDSDRKIAIEYQNPSIQDFLVNYLKGKNDLIKSLLQSSIFTNQFSRIFSTNKIDTKKVFLNKDLSKIAVDKITTNYSELKNSKIIRLNRKKDEISWYKESNIEYSFLENIYSKFGTSYIKLEKLIYNEFQKKIYFNDTTYSEQTSYLKLLSSLDLERFEFNKEQLMDTFIKNINWVDRFELVNEFESLFPTTYRDTIESASFKTKIDSIVTSELENIEESDVYDLKTNLENIETTFNLSLFDEIQELNQRESDYEDYIESQVESHIEEGQFEENETPEINENEEIGEIFNSLLEK